MEDANLVEGVLDCDGVKKGHLAGGLISPVVADLVLSVSIACQAAGTNELHQLEHPGFGQSKGVQCIV